MWRDDDWLDNSQNDMWREEEEEKEKQKKQKEEKKLMEQMEQEEERRLMEQKKPRRKRKKQEPDVSAMPVDYDEMVELATEDLVLKTLREMGCNYTIVEDVPVIRLIHFHYQGQLFFIEVTQDSPYITLSHEWWHVMSMDGDIEEFACMQKAVNDANAYGHVTVCYHFDKEDRTIGLSSRNTILFVEGIPHLDYYLEGMLKLFFRTQRDVMIDMEKYRVRAGLV
ncbi:MAG: hypothetical protein K6D37_00555 [Prevotella sp.]|nr:hypothetical protein [Prevotella sp.]